MIDWGAGEGGFAASRAFAVVAGQGLFQTIAIGWGGKGLPSPQKWSENGVDECEQTEEQKIGILFLPGPSFSHQRDPPSPFFEMLFYQVVQAD